ncbi:hypothetical protein SPI_08663 [Niveomyces insectorum RCEF 264]|uniref:Arrestin-like N-terminal domain-containing protein n=1 Tax=Niveomyces insectorum RCEF 264 TaxID=1081102 RepID=A0A167MV48_9HYPO|nr:hypothetical protein SPI_08663 [Niveomyces insectorum RCEF 264]
MTMRIHLIDPPEYYTNLDTIKGEVRFSLSKPESFGPIVVKLEGESNTSLTLPSVENDDGTWSYKNGPLHDPDPRRTAAGTPPRPTPGTELHEKHKILYQVAQVHPPLKADSVGSPVAILPAGPHVFPFRFKIPFNNSCANPMALARTGGLVDAEGNDDDNDKVNGGSGGGSGPSRFSRSASGIRFMNGSKQLLYRHIKQTLPPSFTGYLGQATIRYFLKATVQRPGLFKENWRHTVDFKFLPIEPPRPAPSSREVFARRPFTFRPRTTPTEAPVSLALPRKKSRFFRSNSASTISLPQQRDPFAPSSLHASPSLMSFFPHDQQHDHHHQNHHHHQQHQPIHALQDDLAPSVQIVAFLPFPAILTCNEPLPLRIVARKLHPSRERVYLTSLDIRLIGTTRLRCQDVQHVKTATWVITTHLGLTIPVCDADDPVNADVVVPNDLWCNKPLPNTVMPSFVTCNVSRDYQLELRVGLSWGLPPLGATTTLASSAPSKALPQSGKRLTKKDEKERKASMKALKAQQVAHLLPQTIILPLILQSIQVYSGIQPNQSLIEAVARHRQQHQQQQQQQPRRPGQHQQQLPQLPQRQGSIYELSAEPPPPAMPPRPNGSASSTLPASPDTTTPSPVSGAELPGFPVIRRRPVPPRFMAQQQREQQQRQNREKFSSPEAPPPPPPPGAGGPEPPSSPLGRFYSSLRRQQPRQQYHLYQQQTIMVDPLYPPQLQPGEDPSSWSLSLSSLSQSPSLSSPSAAANNGSAAAAASHGVAGPPLTPTIASAINAFAFADGDRASFVYEAPPPTYDEAMAEVVSDDAASGSRGSTGDGSGAGRRPAFSGETDVNAVSTFV